MFQIKAAYDDQVEVKATLEQARTFFNEARNFIELMPGVESITTEAGGARRWLIRASVPLLTVMREDFLVVQTADQPERIEWSPAAGEQQNLLRYSASFEKRNAKTLVRIAQSVEISRKDAKELHLLAGWIGAERISAEMQKRVAEMMRSFLRQARAQLEA